LERDTDVVVHRVYFAVRVDMDSLKYFLNFEGCLGEILIFARHLIILSKEETTLQYSCLDLMSFLDFFLVDQVNYFEME